MKTMSVAPFFSSLGTQKQIAMQYSLFAFQCFLSAIHALIHIIFIVTETPPYDREVVESPFECKSVFCKF